MKSKDQYTWELAQIDKGNPKSKAVKAKRQALLEEAKQDGFIWKESVGFIAITADVSPRKGSVTPLNNKAQAQIHTDDKSLTETDTGDIMNGADALMPKDNSPDLLPDILDVKAGPIPSELDDNSAPVTLPDLSQHKTQDGKPNFVSVKKAPQSIRIASRERMQESRPESIKVKAQLEKGHIGAKGYGGIAGY